MSPDINAAATEAAATLQLLHDHINMWRDRQPWHPLHKNGAIDALIQFRTALLERAAVQEIEREGRQANEPSRAGHSPDAPCDPQCDVCARLINVQLQERERCWRAVSAARARVAEALGPGTSAIQWLVEVADEIRRPTSAAAPERDYEAEGAVLRKALEPFAKLRVEERGATDGPDEDQVVAVTHGREALSEAIQAKVFTTVVPARFVYAARRALQETKKAGAALRKQLKRAEEARDRARAIGAALTDLTGDLEGKLRSAAHGEAMLKEQYNDLKQRLETDLAIERQATAETLIQAERDRRERDATIATMRHALETVRPEIAELRHPSICGAHNDGDCTVDECGPDGTPCPTLDQCSCSAGDIRLIDSALASGAGKLFIESYERRAAAIQSEGDAVIKRLGEAYDRQQIILTRIGGTIMDAGSVVVPEGHDGLEDAVRALIHQRDAARADFANACDVGRRLEGRAETRLEPLRRALIQARATIKIADESPKSFTKEQADVTLRMIHAALTDDAAPGLWADGPKCRCGLPSTHENGWCGACATWKIVEKIAEAPGAPYARTAPPLSADNGPRGPSGTEDSDPTRPVVVMPTVAHALTAVDRYVAQLTNEPPAPPPAPPPAEELGALSDEMIDWCLEKGRLEARMAMPSRGANIQQLEHEYREWLKANPKPAPKPAADRSSLLTATTDHPPPKRAAVSFVEREDGRILCVWNRRYGRWSMPGGLVEAGETPEAASRRELEEETGLKTVELCPLYEGPAAQIREGRASLVTVFRVLAKGEPREMEVGCPVTWLTRDEFLEWSPFGAFYTPIFAAMAPTLRTVNPSAKRPKSPGRWQPWPSNIPRRYLGTGVACDMLIGACACGATHDIAEEAPRAAKNVAAAALAHYGLADALTIYGILCAFNQTTDEEQAK